MNRARSNPSAANRGRAWEAQLEAWHHAYQQDGSAVVFRTPPVVKMISTPSRGRFNACFLKDGPPDFMGVVLGRAVVLDAKDCASDRWALSLLEPHQARDLNRSSRAGAFAFIALRLGGEGWVLPWTALGPVWARWGRGEARRGEASLGPSEVAELGLPMDADGWLSAVRQITAREAA